MLNCTQCHKSVCKNTTIRLQKRTSDNRSSITKTSHKLLFIKKDLALILFEIEKKKKKRCERGGKIIWTTIVI